MIFYRFGEIPKNEKSCIWRGDEVIGEEKGVSVYEAHKNINGTYSPVIPFPTNEKAFNDFLYHIEYFTGNKYLVYVEEHLDKSDPKQEFEVFVVWQCYILGNAKWLLSTTLPDGMYYEVTYNKAKNEFYLDAYKKFENRCIPNIILQRI